MSLWVWRTRVVGPTQELLATLSCDTGYRHISRQSLRLGSNVAEDKIHFLALFVPVTVGISFTK